MPRSHTPVSFKDSTNSCFRDVTSIRKVKQVLGKGTQKLQDPRWPMRWFVLVTYTIVLITVLVLGIVLAGIKNNPTFLSIATPPFLLAMRPIIGFLFGSTKKV